MYEIIKNEQFKDNTYLLEVHAPLLAKSIKPGEFVVIMVDDMAERIPMAVYDINGENISILYNVLGYSTNELRNSKSIFSILGPLGNESELTRDIDKYKNKKIGFIVKGTGIASINRISQTLNNNGIVNDIYFYGDVLVDGLKSVDDTNMESIIDNYDVIVSVGSFDFMEKVTDICKNKNKEIKVSLNPLMLDGIGLCGVCRVLIDDKVKFACIDGPEFDGVKVDFDSAKKRINLFKTEEGRRYLQATEGSTFKPEVGGEN